MLIDLKDCAKNSHEQTAHVELVTRLPQQISTPCALDCAYTVEKRDNYFLLHLTAHGEIQLICQRCLASFSYSYQNKTTLAICDSEAYAEQLMNEYECIVSDKNSVDLIEVLTDELHLYCPKNHLNIDECDKEIYNFVKS